MNFAGEGPYRSCRYCTLRIQNCMQFRGQLVTLVVLCLIAVAVLPVTPHPLVVVCGILAAVFVLYYLKYVARESESSIVIQYHLSESRAGLEHAHRRLLEEKATGEGLQRKLQQAQQLEALGRVAAGVAHEINNPLTYVLGNLELLDEIVGRVRTGHLPESDCADASDAIRDVRTGAQRIARIVQDIRQFSRQREEDLRNVDLGAVAQTAARTVRARFDGRAELVLDLAPAPRVFADDDKLTQVVTNLLTNALDATEGRPQPRIELRVRADAAGNAALEVCDNGTGIPADKLERIFDPFFTTKAPGRGTGLGLAICQGIVGASGGRLEVSTELGRGSCFRVSLPRSTRADSAAPEDGATAADHRLRGTSILVIDDDELVSRLLRGVLREARVTTATSAQEGMARLAEGPYDLVVCDVNMPEVSGVGFYRQVAARWPGTEHRIVFSTGGAGSPELQELLAAADNPVLPKPYTPSAVRAMLGARLAGLGRRIPSEPPTVP